MYDLLIIGGGPAGMTAAVYAARKKLKTLLLGKDLGGQPKVVIISAAGTTTLSVPMMEEMVREANGDLVASYTLWTLIPNRLRYGIDDPEEIMRREAKLIPVPEE